MALAKEQEFFILLLQSYAAYKNISASEALTIWEKNDLVDYINDMYFRYHIERLENAFEDIDEILDTIQKS